MAQAVAIHAEPFHVSPMCRFVAVVMSGETFRQPAVLTSDGLSHRAPLHALADRLPCHTFRLFVGTLSQLTLTESMFFKADDTSRCPDPVDRTFSTSTTKTLIEFLLLPSQHRTASTFKILGRFHGAIVSPHTNQVAPPASIRQHRPLTAAQGSGSSFSASSGSPRDTGTHPRHANYAPRPH